MRQGAPQLAWLLLTLYTCGHLVWESRAPGRPAAVGSSSSSGREEGCPSYPGPAPGAFGAGSVPVDTDCSLVAENSAAAALQAPALGPAGCLWAWLRWPAAPAAPLHLLPSPSPTLPLALAHLLAAALLLWGVLLPLWRSRPPSAARVAAVHCTARLVLPLAHLGAAGWVLWHQQQQQEQQEQPQTDLEPSVVLALEGAGWSWWLGLGCTLQALLLQLPPRLQLLVGAAEVLLWQAMRQWLSQASPAGLHIHHPQQLLVTWCLGYVLPLCGVLGRQHYRNRSQPPTAKAATTAAGTADRKEEAAAHTPRVSADMGSRKVHQGINSSSRRSSSSSVGGSVEARPRQSPLHEQQQQPHHRYPAVSGTPARGAGRDIHTRQPCAATAVPPIAATAATHAAGGKAAAAAAAKGAAVHKGGARGVAVTATVPHQDPLPVWGKGQPSAALRSHQEGGGARHPPLVRHDSASHATMLLKVAQAEAASKAPPPQTLPPAAATAVKMSAAATVMATLHALLLVPQQLCRRWQLLRAAAVPGSVLLLADVAAPKQLQQQQGEEEEGRTAPGVEVPEGPHLQAQAYRGGGTWYVPLLHTMTPRITTPDPTLSAAEDATITSASGGSSSVDADVDDSTLDSCQGLELASPAAEPGVSKPRVLVPGVVVFDTLQQLEEASNTGMLQQLLQEAVECSGTKAVAVAPLAGGPDGDGEEGRTWQTSLWLQGVTRQQAAVAPGSPAAAASATDGGMLAGHDGTEACSTRLLPSSLRVVVCQGFRVLLDQQLPLSGDSVVCQVTLGSPEVTPSYAGATAAAACSIHLLPPPLSPETHQVVQARPGAAGLDPASTLVTTTGRGVGRSPPNSSSSSSGASGATDNVPGRVFAAATAAATAAAEPAPSPVWVPTQVTLLLLPEAVTRELVTWVAQHRLSLSLVTPLVCDLALLLDAHQQLQQVLSAQVQPQQPQQAELEDGLTAAAGAGTIWQEPTGQLSLGQLAAGIASDLGGYLEASGLTAAADLVARVKQQLLMCTMALQPHAAGGAGVMGLEALTPLLLPTSAAVRVVPQAGQDGDHVPQASPATTGGAEEPLESSGSSGGASSSGSSRSGDGGAGSLLAGAQQSSTAHLPDQGTGSSSSSSSSSSSMSHQQPPHIPQPDASSQTTNGRGHAGGLTHSAQLGGIQPAAELQAWWFQVWRLPPCVVAGLVLAVAVAGGVLLQGVAVQ